MTNDEVFKVPRYLKRYYDWIVGYASRGINCKVKIRRLFLATNSCTREERAQFKDLLLPENSVCKFVGFTRFKIGSQGIKFSSALPYFEQFADWYDDLSVTSKINKDKIMMKGGTGAILPVLEKMAEEPKCKFTYEDLYEAFCLRHQYINLPFCGSVKKLSLSNVKLNPKSSSGFLSGLLGGFSRADAYSFSKVVALKLFELVKSQSISCVSFWRFGVRPKIVDLGKEGELKARPIALCDSVLNFIAGVVAQTITFRMMRAEHNEIFLGKSLNRDDIRWIAKGVGRCGNYLYYSPDWNNFDASIYEELIVFSGLMLKQCFNGGHSATNLFHYLITSVIDKYVLLDPGVIFKFMKGLPSGHPFTSLMGTLINWLVWSTIFVKYTKLHPETKLSSFRCIVSGDDSLIRVPADIIEEDLNNIINSSGLNLDSIIGEGTPFWTDNHILGAHLLRRRFYIDDTTIWDESYIYGRLSNSEDNRWTVNNAIDQTSNYLLSSPSATKVNRVLTNYLHWLIMRSNHRTSLLDSASEQLLANYYSDIFLPHGELRKLVYNEDHNHSTFNPYLSHKGNTLILKDKIFVQGYYSRPGLKLIFNNLRFPKGKNKLRDYFRSKHKLEWSYHIKKIE